MEDDKALAAIVDTMIAAGESDDDIQFVIAEHRRGGRPIANSGARDMPTDLAGQEAVRQQNMAAQAGVGTNPTPVADGLSTIPGSVAKLGIGAVKGFGKAALAAVDPRTYVGLAGAAADLMVPTRPGAEQRTRDRISGMVGGVRDAFGDPAKTGDLIGQTTAGFVLPRIVPKVPNGMVRAGETMEAAATSPFVQRAVHPAAAAVAGATGFGSGSIVGGMVAGAATEAIPYSVAATGRGVARIGRKMGATTGRNAGGTLVKAPQTMEEMLTEARGLEPAPPMPESAELPSQPELTPGGRPSISMEQASPVNPHMNPAGRTVGRPDGAYAPPVPVKPPNPNAGGRLVQGQPIASTEDMLAGVVQNANTPARPPADMTPPPVNPLEQAGRSLSGEEIATRQQRQGASPAPETPLAQVGEQSQPAAAAPVDAPPPLSLIREQLEASLAKSGLKVSEVPNPSKSRAGSRGSGPSATKGYSRADLESIGLDPDVPLTRPLTERETAIVNAARSQRHEHHYGAAVSDAALKRSTARGQP